jgi:uncharacterized protein (DUF58 family)
VSAGPAGPARSRWWPQRTIRPTREGWWCVLAALGLGFAAMNTRNNLLYLLVSMLLGLIVVSGILSEQSIRRVRVRGRGPDDLHAGVPALLGATVTNTKRRMPSYSLSLEDAAGRRLAFVPRLAPGAEHVVSWQATLPTRGRHRLPGLRLTTRFPFGLFTKSGPVLLDGEVIVFPALRPLSAAERREAAGAGPARRRRGRGHELHNLREYRAGDDPRFIHWKSSAKGGTLLVRETEADAAPDTRIVLEGTGARDRARLEAGLSEAASLAVHLLGAGAAVGLVGPGVAVPLGRGRAQRRALLTALALYEPASRPGPPAVGAGRPGVADLVVRLG